MLADPGLIVAIDISAHCDLGLLLGICEDAPGQYAEDINKKYIYIYIYIYMYIKEATPHPPGLGSRMWILVLSKAGDGSGSSRK